VAFALTGPAHAATLYFNGFETNIAGWNVFGGSFDATRVASGTNFVTSATGGFHAESATPSGAAGNFGGYNFGAGNAVPTAFQEYYTSVAVFLDLTATINNDVRFDYSSAINNNGGTFLRDFVFNAGFYNGSDLDAPGGGANRFIISASNNAGRANSFPKNPGRDPFAILDSGWFTFQHHFYESGGFLNVDMSIFDSSNALLHTWTLGGTDAIAGVGGNRYGWFVNNEFQVLAFDDTELRTADTSAVPEPGTITLLGFGLLALASTRLRTRKS
jgi:hypothetical protein